MFCSRFRGIVKPRKLKDSICSTVHHRHLDYCIFDILMFLPLETITVTLVTDLYKVKPFIIFCKLNNDILRGCFELASRVQGYACKRIFTTFLRFRLYLHKITLHSLMALSVHMLYKIINKQEIYLSPRTVITVLFVFPSRILSFPSTQLLLVV